MKLPSLTALAKLKAKFVRYQDRKLWYVIEYDWHEDPLSDSSRFLEKFEFPIPVNDAGGGEFFPEDKGIRFMRWIRMHLEYLRSSLDGGGVVPS